MFEHPKWQVNITRAAGSQTLTRSQAPVQAIIMTTFSQPIINDELEVVAGVCGDTMLLDFTNPADLQQLGLILQHALNNPTRLESITLEILKNDDPTVDHTRETSRDSKLEFVSDGRI